MRKDKQEELGDLLLQIMFHAVMAEEKGLFTFEDVAKTISDKMIRRHPHVLMPMENGILSILIHPQPV